ncbi:MAG: TIR domain-containing protein [Spirosomataceae bacterium]
MKIDQWLEKINAKRVASIQEIKIKHKQTVLNFHSENKPKIISKLHYYQNEYGDIVGLNIAALDPKTHEEFIEVWKANYSLFSEKLEALYMYNNVDILELKNFPKLTYLNVSQSPELTTLHVDKAPNLKEIHASLCPKLTEVKLGAELNELEKLDISKSPVETFETKTELKNLAYFIAFETKFKQLNLAHMSQIKYLIAPKSKISEIDWTKVTSLPKLESIELPSEYTSDINRITEILKQHVGLDLRKELNNYLKTLSQSGSQSQKRLKILLLGNTTSGKSTLRRILFSKAGKEIEAATQEGIDENNKETSTHGAIIETETLNLASVDYQIQVFDFGGQDYYHATHLPFYQAHTWHILIYGPDEDTELNSAYEYGQKTVEGRDEVLFPITYWLKSVSSYGGSSSDETTQKSSNPKVNLVQNIKKGCTTSWELDRFTLKKLNGLNVDEFKEYNFHEDAPELKKWVFDKIKTHAREEKILIPALKLHKKIEGESNILLTINQVHTMSSSEDLSNSIDYLKELHANHLGYFFQFQEDSPDSENISTKLNAEKSFFIRDLTQFSQWIHQILSKELISRNGQHGYFNREEATKRLRTKAAKGHIDKIITFLEKEHIIFPVQGKTDTWIAPSYLSAPKLQVEQLLLASFDEPDVKIFLPDFFHTNLIHVLIKEFKDSLVQDPENKTYLLWKNKILLYEDNKKEKSNQKAFLLLELIYPMDAEYSKYKIENSALECPVLVIRRNQSGFVAESIFAKIYQYINKHFTDKNITKEIWLKSKLGDYIPIDCLNQNNKNTYSERLQSVYYNETFYPMRDFQYFINEGYKLPNKVFIAYSKANADLLEEFILHLQPYRERGELDFFYDKELRMGDKWDEAIKKELLDSDKLVCLISPHLLNTHYVTHLELPLAIEKGKEIIPIILEDCDWMNLPIRGKNKILNEYLGQFNAPKKGEYISSNRSERQKEWNLLAKKLTLKSNDRTLSQTPGHSSGLDQPDGRE